MWANKMIKKIKKTIGKIWKKTLIGVCIGSIAIASITIPIEIINKNSIGNDSNAVSSSQYSSNFDNGTDSNMKNVVNPDLSTVWINNNKTTQFVQNSFVNLEHYKLNEQNSLVTMIQTANGISQKDAHEKAVFDNNLAKTAKLMSKLTVKEQNQAKNAMLEMDTNIENHHLNIDNLANVVNKIAGSKYTPEIDSYIRSEAKKHKELLEKEELNKNVCLYENPYPTLNLYSNTFTVSNSISQVGDAVDTLSGVAVAAGIFSACMYFMAFWTCGSSLMWANGSAVIAAVAGATAGGLALYNDTQESDANQVGWSYAYTDFVHVFDLAGVIAKIAVALTTTEATVSSLSWVFPAACAVLGLTGLLVSVLLE